MAKLGIEITPDAVVEVDLAPGMPVPKSLVFEYAAADRETFEGLVRVLGGLEAFSVMPEFGSAARHAIPVTWDGEQVGTARVTIRAAEEMRHPVPGAFPDLEALAEQREELVHRARLEA